MTTQSQFVNQTNMPELANAVIEQIGGWDTFTETAPDVANHGADAGFSGFTYYSDTVKFAEDNKNSILAACREMADELGESGAYSLIAGFNCLNGEYTVDHIADVINGSVNDDDGDKTGIFNALAWFALEEVSRAYADMLETAQAI